MLDIIQNYLNINKNKTECDMFSLTKLSKIKVFHLQSVSKYLFICG